MARHSASNRATFSVMLSSTMKMARAPARPRVGDVGQHAIDRPGVKVPAAHLDDRAEAAVVGAAARRLDDVDRPADERVARQHPCGAVGQRHVLAGQAAHRPVGIADEGRALPIRQAGDAAQVAAAFERAQELAEGQVALAAHDDVDAPCRILVDLRGEARVVAADDNGDAGLERAHERDDFRAVPRWNVMTDRPTTSGSTSRIRRSTVWRTSRARESGRQSRRGDGDRRCRRARRARRSASASSPSPCARRSRASRGGGRSSDFPLDLVHCPCRGL